MAELLQISDIRQTFRNGFWLKKAEILKGVSFTVPESSVFGFLGANGAGKTTLIHLITGIRAPSSGSIRVQGLNPRTKEARALIGYLPERPYFHEHLTARSTLEYFGRLSQMETALLKTRIPEVLEIVGLKDVQSLELKKFSKGMLQRIGIAQAILHNPKFLVLDEPMSGLDPVGRRDVRELIRKLASEGKTIFFSTHVIPDIEAICDRVAVISQGKIVADGSVASLLTEGVPRSEMVLSGIEGEHVNNLSGLVELRKVPEGFKILIEGADQVQASISSIIQSGGKVLSLTPIRPTLEAFFENGRSI